MSSSYTGNPTATEAPSSAPSPAGAPIVVLPSDGDPANAASLAQALKVSADWIAFLSQQGRGTFFDDHFGRGTGADGNQASGFGTMNLTRDMEWNNLTMAATDVINTNGFIIRVRGTFTSVAGATINYPAATTSFQGTAGCGGLGGAAAGAGSSVFGLGGSGGAGGNTGGGAGAPGTVTAPTWAWRSPPALFNGGSVVGFVNGVASIRQLQGGAGGSGGGNNGGTGGTGGGGGAVGWIVAQTWNVTGLTVNVNGGNGGNGSGGNANGGGGGGGGAFVAVGAVWTAFSVTVSANGGTGGALVGTGAAGAPGSAGNTTPYQIQL